MLTLDLICRISNSVGTVPILQFSPGLGTEASIPRFHCTVSGTSLLVPTSQYKAFGTQFSGIICIFLISILFWFHCDTTLAPNQVEPKVSVLKLN